MDRNMTLLKYTTFGAVGIVLKYTTLDAAVDIVLKYSTLRMQLVLPA